jgi:argininosuccinate lyase
MSNPERTFPHAVYERVVLQPFFRDAQQYYYEPMLAANRAHAVMLFHCEIITQENAHALLGALERLENAGIEKLRYQSGVEDLFFAMERKLIEDIGSAFGGNLQLARSRNDLGYALTRLALRPLILDTIDQLLAFRKTLFRKAKQHLDTIMPGYTHTQPAQPTTMAHYLAGILSTLERDTTRLFFAYNTNNQSPLGAAAFTGTGFPINRELTAQLLGFDTVIHSTYDSIAASDNLTDVAAAISSLGINLSRFTRDMLFWATQEAGAIRIDDSFIQISSIMPQKRNPVVLEHLRARISRMVSLAGGITLQCHHIPFGDTQDIEDEIFPLLFGSLETAIDVLNLYYPVIDTLQVNVDHLRQRATAGFTTVTELADTLVRHSNLPFRQAHSIVSEMVSYALGNSLQPDQLTVELLNTVAKNKIETSLNLTEEQLQSALDPESFVRSRKTMGGSAPTATEDVLDAQQHMLREHHVQVHKLKSHLAGAEARLQAEIEAVLS